MNTVPQEQAPAGLGGVLAVPTAALIVGLLASLAFFALWVLQAFKVAPLGVISMETGLESLLWLVALAFVASHWQERHQSAPGLMRLLIGIAAARFALGHLIVGPDSGPVASIALHTRLFYVLVVVVLAVGFIRYFTVSGRVASTFTRPDATAPVLTIAKRELSGLFFSPIAYVVLGLFALGTAFFFLREFGPGQPASLRGTFEALVWVMILLMPALSMRLVSEELRSGTFETLMTAPINSTQVILGKWLGTMGFLLVLLSPLLVMVGVLEIHGKPDYGPIWCGLLGLVLVGGLYLAIGIFASSVTQNQIIALVLTIFIILILTLGMYLLPQQKIVPNSIKPLLYYLNVNLQFEDFGKGLIDLSRMIYFLSGIALFLFAAERALRARRW